MDPRKQTDAPGAEQARLAEDDSRAKNWKRWGPYLSERQWGTVREDYSASGESWDYFPHDHARSRAYRWGEDGLLGITDRECRLCFALALWNGRDTILKERLFGLTGDQGNHGEDVKESYFYLDSTPTHSYLRGLYKYPQAAFPYERLIEENARRGKQAPEFELADTGVFDDGRYFDVLAEYAKAPAVTRERIFIETMQQILSSTSKIMLDYKGGGNLLYLPLDKLMQQAGAGASLAPGAAASAAPAEAPAAADTGPRSRDSSLRARERGERP